MSSSFILSLVHRDPELGSPSSDSESESSVRSDASNSDKSELATTLVVEDGGDQSDLEHGGDDIEDKGGESEEDSTRSTVNGFRQDSCLSVQMVVQIHLVEMKEDSPCNTTNGVMRYFCKDTVPEFREKRGSCSSNTIWRSTFHVTFRV